MKKRFFALEIFSADSEPCDCTISTSNVEKYHIGIKLKFSDDIKNYYIVTGIKNNKLILKKVKINIFKRLLKIIVDFFK